MSTCEQSDKTPMDDDWRMDRGLVLIRLAYELIVSTWNMLMMTCKLFMVACDL